MKTKAEQYTSKKDIKPSMRNKTGLVNYNNLSAIFTQKKFVVSGQTQLEISFYPEKSKRLKLSMLGNPGVSVNKTYEEVERKTGSKYKYLTR